MELESQAVVSFRVGAGKELNLGPPKQQPVLSASEPSLQDMIIYSFCECARHTSKSHSVWKTSVPFLGHLGSGD